MENDDLLDLCRLNQLEENTIDVDIDAGTTMGIKWKKRRLIKRIVNNRPKISKQIIDDHIQKNSSKNGVYPFDFDDEEYPELIDDTENN